VLAPRGCRLLTVSRGEWAEWWTGAVLAGIGAAPSLSELLGAGDPGDPIERTSSSDPAYITFTSGSTGPSKAVVLSHGSFLAGVPAFQMFTNLAPLKDDVFFPSLGWANSGGLRTMTFPALYFGLPVVGIDHLLADGRAVAELLTGLRVSVALLMPQILRQLRTLDAEIHGYDWSALRVIATTGEPISSEIREWLEESLGAVINPYYGASEISYVASACRVWFPSAPGEVGRRVPGRELTVVNEDSLLPTEPGAAGMLAVRRSDLGLSLGYLRAGEDEPSFDASSATDEFFLTGDLGILSDDGNVRYLGRSGQSIRVGAGETIPPMDVEDVVQSVTAVREVAVVQSQDDPPGVVCACVSLIDADTDGTSLAQEIGAAVSARLEQSVRVARVVILEELPKTAGTAKINRRRAAEIAQTGEPAPVATIVLDG
jgi:acetyl-CoA synthetase